ncbi:hypothetical protein DQG13_28800 [Paenibacillus sp. YN15]|nr:hypothetical protein DQG13_28800 [Paenibacillus sp. YN15]
MMQKCSYFMGQPLKRRVIMQKCSSFTRISAFLAVSSEISALLHDRSKKGGSQPKITALSHYSIGRRWTYVKMALEN